MDSSILFLSSDERLPAILSAVPESADPPGHDKFAQSQQESSRRILRFAGQSAQFRQPSRQDPRGSFRPFLHLYYFHISSFWK